jgi:hypothetical protein
MTPTMSFWRCTKDLVLSETKKTPPGDRQSQGKEKISALSAEAFRRESLYRDQ